MVDFNQLNGLYEKYVGKVYGNLMGDLYSIYRPDYSVSDNAPALIYSGVRYRVDPAGPKFAEPTFNSAEFYSIFGDRSLVQPGDILVYGTIDDIDIQRPYITIGHQGPIKELVGFRTSRKCHVATNRNQEEDTYNYLYENVYYDILDVGYPSSTISGNVRGSEQLPNQKLIMYYRPDLDLRQLIVDIDPTTGEDTNFRYKTKSIDYSGPIMILSVEQDYRS